MPQNPQKEKGLELTIGTRTTKLYKACNRDVTTYNTYHWTGNFEILEKIGQVNSEQISTISKLNQELEDAEFLKKTMQITLVNIWAIYELPVVFKACNLQSTTNIIFENKTPIQIRA
ncbi:hypothetical protein PGTUg99_017151 [Puccinia graminis f. sp. tritici]|uniref:Uncharacterized protein n=1 Tax=Puccinia graminis f. sp. tritici TaxID=56615 RepID=A0A5B0SA74_PUCGR|nr:hypothetical protein PGTUg99_017151 [Puccinia graminis f. sp. tritici]